MEEAEDVCGRVGRGACAGVCSGVCRGVWQQLSHSEAARALSQTTVYWRRTAVDAAALAGLQGCQACGLPCSRGRWKKNDDSRRFCTHHDCRPATSSHRLNACPAVRFIHFRPAVASILPISSPPARPSPSLPRLSSSGCSATMSVVGCDLGSLNTVIAVARNRGVDVVSMLLSCPCGRQLMLV